MKEQCFLLDKGRVGFLDLVLSSEPWGNYLPGLPQAFSCLRKEQVVYELRVHFTVRSCSIAGALSPDVENKLNVHNRSQPAAH